MTTEIQHAFDAIRSGLIVETFGNVFQIDVQQEAGREAFRLRYPWSDVVTATALDVRPKQRHLVLDVAGQRLPIRGRYLCGHDERHWFVANLPIDPRTTTVPGAMEALKPAIVLRAQKRLGVKSRRHRRKTAAYVRQGEWFFLPRPMMHVGELAIRNGQLARPVESPTRWNGCTSPPAPTRPSSAARSRIPTTKRSVSKSGIASRRTPKCRPGQSTRPSRDWRTSIKASIRRSNSLSRCRSCCQAKGLTYSARA